MSNPFSEHFQNDPLSQMRSDEEQRRLAAEQTQNEELERQRKYKESVADELRLYEPLVVEVLEQLRESAYPNYKMRQPKSTETIPITCRWQLGSWRLESSHSFKGYEQTNWEFDPVVSVGLSIDAQGKAQKFIVTFYGIQLHSEGPRSTQADALRREQQVSLTKEALVQALIDFHTPNERSTKILEHMPAIKNALNRLAQNPKFREHISYGAHFKETYWGEYVGKDIYSELPLDEGEHSFSLGSLHNSTFDLVSNSEYHSGYTEIAGSQQYATVSLAFDEQDTPIHYKCWLRGVEQPFTASLGEEALYLQLVKQLDIYERKAKDSQASTQQPQKKKKGWFGR